MIKEREYYEDEKIVFFDYQGQVLVQGLLIDFVELLCFEQFEEWMIYVVCLCLGEVFNVSLNLLVVVVFELFLEVVWFKYSIVLENFVVFKEWLIFVMKFFEFCVVQDGVENSQVMVVCYVLCMVVDEVVVIILWGNESEWLKISLLSSFYNEIFGGEKFFQLFDWLLKNLVKYLLMLELMYFCLVFGFEGKYWVMVCGVFDLDGIFDVFYWQICQLCGDVLCELLLYWQGFSDQCCGLVWIVFWWMVVLFILVCLVVMYLGFVWVFGE